MNQGIIFAKKEKSKENLRKNPANIRCIRYTFAL